MEQLIKKHGLKLQYIFNTHHHYDHVGGNVKLKESQNCKIVAYAGDVNHIPAYDLAVNDGDIFSFGRHNFEIIYTPGHTLGHIAYLCKKQSYFSAVTLYFR